MIYFTTFIFTLLLSHIARAAPACDDVASPMSAIPVYKVTWDATYDNPDGNTNGVACSNGPYGLAPRFPQLGDFPDFPYLGGAFDTKWGSPNCGKCWRLSDISTGRWIYLTAIDAAGGGFNIGKTAFSVLNGGTVGSGTLEAEAIPVSSHFCGL